MGNGVNAIEIPGDWLASSGLSLPPVAGKAVAIFDLEPVS